MCVRELTVILVTSTSPATSTPSSTSAPRPDTTNVGAIAGGVVGGVAALALLALAVWWFVLRKKKTAKVAQPDGNVQSQGKPHETQPMLPEKVEAHQQAYETSKYEADSQPLPAELGQEVVRAELEGEPTK